jgi:hypothetical protein
MWVEFVHKRKEKTRQTKKTTSRIIKEKAVLVPGIVKLCTAKIRTRFNGNQEGSRLSLNLLPICICCKTLMPSLHHAHTSSQS